MLVAFCIFIVGYMMRPSAVQQAEQAYQAARNARHLEDGDATIAYSIWEYLDELGYTPV